jgi:hypothetical protein
MVRLLNQLRSSERICAVIDFLDNALLYQFFDFVFDGWRIKRACVGPGGLVDAGTCCERALVAAV